MAEPRLEPALRLRQAVAVVALLAGATYLAWRWGFTLRWGSAWLGVPLALAESWMLLAVALFVFESWRLAARPAPPAPARRTVAILVPTFDESPEVLRPTVLGALAVQHDPRPEVWVLDDGERAWVAELCNELGCRYLVRPAPRRHAKAGNLNNALEHVTAELLFVLDADHVPLPHALERTTGWFDDPEVAFVQSPQVFFNRGFQHPRSADDPTRNEQSLFYEVVCRGKDRNNATFWCGSSAVLRRQALVSVGGVATDTVVEDTHTAMLLHARGWKSIFHDEVLAVGLAPEDVGAFLVQRGRWARGCFQLLRRRNPLLMRGLSLRQRLHYFASVTHYVEGPQRLVTLAVPPLVLLTGTLPLSTSSPLLFCGLFVPQLVLVPLATRLLARGRYRFSEGERYALVRAATYAKAARALVSGRPIAFAVTPKGATGGSRTVLRVPLAIAALSIAGIGYQSTAQLIDLPGRLPVFAYVVTVFWASVSAGLLGWVTMWSASVRHRRRAHRFPVRVDALYRLTREPGHTLTAEVTDLSPFGLAMRVSALIPVGEHVELAFVLEGERVAITGTVVRATAIEDGSVLGVAFDPAAAAVVDTVTRWCFRNPFGPTAVVRELRRPAGEPLAA